MGAVIGGDFQKQAFQQRLVRIEAGGENTTRHLHVGPVDEANPGASSRKARREAAALRRGRRTLPREILLLPVVLALGGLAVVAARAVGFHMLSGLAFHVQYNWYADLALAVLLVLILRAGLGLSGGMRGKAVLAGFAIMALFQPLIVARAPAVFALIYSEAYVAETLVLVGPV